MCITVGTALLISSIVSAGTAAYTVYQSKKASNEAKEYNAGIADIQANEARKRGKEEERAHRLRVARLKGEQRAGFAGSGVVVDEGSALLALEDTAYFGEQDALTVRRNAALEAWSFKSEAVGLRRTKGSPLVAAGTTLLTEAASSYSSYAGGK